MICTIHRAKYVLTEPKGMMENGAVSIADSGQISGVTRWESKNVPGLHTVTDWGSAIIVPGFINCHAHLELTHLHNRVRKFSSFTDWLSQLIALRRKWSQNDYLDSVLSGAQTLLESGTVMVGDISASGVSWRALKETRLRKIIFVESTALSPERAHEAAAALETRLDEVVPDPLLTSGISPHAPYSVSPELFRAAAGLARRRGIPLATHVAESPAELEFLEHGTGEFREFLTGLAALPADWRPPRLGPIQYLHSLDMLDRPGLLIHCNYLDYESKMLILNSRCSVVYCPRSHAFFGHSEHPVRSLLDMGVNVALGTDSLASNDTLSMLDEMRFLFGRRKDLTCEQIFRMATINGASAMQMPGLGRLAPGHWADMAIMKVPPEISAKHLVEQILEGAGECIATIIGGEVVWQKHNPGE